MNVFKKGQGAQNHVHNKFEKLTVEHIWDNDYNVEEEKIQTQLIEVFPKTIVNAVKSTDLPFAQSMNPYQGCEHGCSYCYARPTHEFWSYNAGIDFERKILYKPNAAELLGKHFLKKNYLPKTIMLSGNTDCYQPAERTLEITRKVLEVFLKYKHPVSIITKNALLLRDLDLLIELQKDNLVSVAVSVTTLDEKLRSKLEPRTSSIANRLKVIRTLSENNIPVVGMIAPIIPFINSDEIFAIAKKLSENGAFTFGYTLVRLNDSVESVFVDWVKKYFPDRSEKVLNHIKATHHGNLGSTISKERMKGSGIFADSIHQTLQIAKEKFFKGKVIEPLNTKAFRLNIPKQLRLFD